MSATPIIDVYVDLVCPWCLIGKRHLESALTQWQHDASAPVPIVRWHSVQLLPDAPAEGWDFHAFYLKRLGSEESIRQRRAQVNAAAAQAGLQIDFSGIARMPNTLQAHRLLFFAQRRLEATEFSALLEQLFAAHFHDGDNLGERAVLIRIAAHHGLDGTELDACLDASDVCLSGNDVPSVPYFVFNQRVALSGAQSPDDLLEAMRQAAVPAACGNFS